MFFKYTERERSLKLPEDLLSIIKDFSDSELKRRIYVYARGNLLYNYGLYRFDLEKDCLTSKRNPLPSGGGSYA